MNRGRKIKELEMAESKGGCLPWVLLIMGFVPGVFIAMRLPESGQFVAFVASVVAVVFCVIMAIVNKKPEFEDETFGHACKRFMWKVLGGVALGVAVSLGYFVFGGVDKASNAGGERAEAESSEVSK